MVFVVLMYKGQNHMEETSQKYEKARYHSAKDGIIGQGGSKMERPKKPTFLLSVAIPFLFAPSFIGAAINYVGSFVTPNSYAEEAEEEAINGLGNFEEKLKKEIVKYEPTIVMSEPKILKGRVVTAYNAIEGQTDGTPCSGAYSPHSGIDFCGTVLPIVATNELPLGTIVRIDGRIFLVADRTKSDYKYRYDILTPTYNEAIQWGNQIHIVEIIGKVVKENT